MIETLLQVFFSVFIAELGDKTQLATILFATKKESAPALVFCAASAALVCSSLIAVLVGNVLSDKLEFIPFKLIAGLGFIAIGVYSILEHFKLV